jgi:hypothetical protein
VLTAKDFATPLGMVETDKEFVSRHKKMRQDLLPTSISIAASILEFQVCLKYAAQQRAGSRTTRETI